MDPKSNAFLTLVISCSIFGCQDPAASDPIAKVSPEVASIASAWGMCQANKRLELSTRNSSAEDVSDQVLLNCAEFETQLQKALELEYGIAGAATTVKDLQARFRNAGIASVNEMRGGPVVEDPSSAWGRCIGSKIDEFLLRGASPNSVADAALDACKEYERAIRSAIAKKHGVAQADSNIVIMKAEMRRLAVEMIESEQ